MAIEADPTWGEKRSDAGRKGLAAARSLALLSYRGPTAYNRSQPDPEEKPDPFFHRVHSYQTHQGEKLCRRFDAYSYVRICESSDSHDVGRGRGGVLNALGRIKANTRVIGISSDILFPPETQRELARMIPGARYEEMPSDFAHDGFLVEHKQLNDIMKKWRSSR